MDDYLAGVNAWPGEHPIFGGYAAAWASTGPWFYSLNRAGDLLINEINNWMKALPECQLYTDKGVPPANTHGFYPTSEFPYPSMGPITTNGWSWVYQGNSAPLTPGLGGQTMSEAYNGPGKLQGVIENKGKFIYVWRTAADNQFSPFAGYYSLSTQGPADETP